MKYCVLIIDGAAGLPLTERGNQTCLELADTPNLDALAQEGTTGLVRTVPPGMEPSSACACLSILGYDPKVYYRGRASIEARSLGIAVADGEAVFRCNLCSHEPCRSGPNHNKIIVFFLHDPPLISVFLNRISSARRFPFYPLFHPGKECVSPL